ncbi:hypothetical protein ABE504_16150 [Paenibacillus oryzisoli]|uniref:hypothetical protein n=1 Tax=Paenibacillus oryzisoli TaxID=1850517 RepID=UPI003D28F855
MFKERVLYYLSASNKPAFFSASPTGYPGGLAPTMRKARDAMFGGGSALFM